MNRYIDADELIEFFDSYPDHIEFDVEDIKSIINEQDTADVRENVQLDVCPLYGGACGYPSGECYDCPRHGNFRENVRGEWIFPYGDKKYKRCSVCGSVFYSIPYNTNFCPNCGADMRPISALSENVEIVSNLKRGES